MTVKRILPAAALAIAVHGLLLGTEPEWLKKKPVDMSKLGVVTLTLASYKPQQPEIASKRRAPPVRDKEPKGVSRPKPPQRISRPPRPVRAAPRPVKGKMPQKISDTQALSSPATSPELNQTGNTERASDLAPGFIKGGASKKTLEETSRIASKRSGPILREAIPIYRENPLPPYPKAARRRGYEGTTVLEVLVDRKGRVGELRVFTSSGYPILDRAAKVTVRKWLFEPAKRGVEKVEMWVRIPIRFKLK